ncbi:hypothetical protein [Pseudomonas sp. JL3]|uniref:hypothetical protein n=1 Tax=Pseudomonas sp. JL3 TaxID=2919943 RepID=UPI00285E5119|nr:hypothetical protein [Pseudomonas sp. JL3]MDR8365031.1 hypothetical protein [Pseudomonas sp. JL3]
MNYVELIQRQAEQAFGNKVKAEVTRDAGSLTDSRDSQIPGCGRLARRHQRTLGGGFFGHNQTGHQRIIMRQYVRNEG